MHSSRTMADSDEESFDEPVFKTSAADEEPETQPLDFEDDAEVAADDDRASPFIEQMPDTPPPPPHLLQEQPALPTTPSKIAQFASKMGMISTTEQGPSSAVRAIATNLSENRPSAMIMKRSAKLTLSPTKTIKRKRFGCDDAVSTFVFMDFETTGMIGGNNDNEYRLLESKLREPQDYSNTLTKLILETQRDEFPRITEMSFISVPREVFIRGQARMKEMSDKMMADKLQVRLVANVHTRQVNPQLDDKQWNAYETSRLSGKCSINLAREDLILKRTFAEEWPAVRAFLELCPKPACLVAHNGLSFDYRVLYGELTRCGFIEKDMGIPDGVVFVDTWLAIRELEEKHRTELQQATKMVDWKMLSEQVCLNRVQGCEDIPAAVEEDNQRGASRDRRGMDLAVHLPQQFPNDPKTPTRPPPTRSTHSEPAKLSGRRRLFGDELPGIDHPLLFLNTEEWSPAKRRRVRPEYFKRIDGGRWDFNRTVAQMNTKNKLTTIYETVLKAEYNAHFAQDDTEALIQVCLAYGKEFLDYADNKAADFPF